MKKLLLLIINLLNKKEFQHSSLFIDYLININSGKNEQNAKEIFLLEIIDT